MLSILQFLLLIFDIPVQSILTPFFLFPPPPAALRDKVGIPEVVAIFGDCLVVGDYEILNGCCLL
jgi:hypothetical protein